MLRHGLETRLVIKRRCTRPLVAWMVQHGADKLMRGAPSCGDLWVIASQHNIFALQLSFAAFCLAGKGAKAPRSQPYWLKIASVEQRFSNGRGQGDRRLSSFDSVVPRPAHPRVRHGMSRRSSDSSDGIA